MMNWMGIGFLIWLSWKIASAPLLKSTDSKSTDPNSSESRSPVGFIGAALFQWINPKSWIVGTGAVSAYFRPHSEEVILYSFIFAFLFVIVAIPSNLIWLSFGAMIEHLFGNPVVARTFNIVMGILLTVSTVLLLL
jgi:threonine/homoserine/homoserine lactone efflux protein